MELLLGNKNYSSWSMRAGLVAAAFDLPVTTSMVWLEQPGAAAQKVRWSPAGRVPILRDGSVTVWDSLAICEYLAERFPQRGLWPADRGDRARARSLCAEMHSGFQAMRQNLPMNIRARKPARQWPADVAKEIARLSEIFAGARQPYLFGSFSIADAFFAPVACRFLTYGVDAPGPAGRYCTELLQHPAVRGWIAAATAEAHAIAKYD